MFVSVLVLRSATNAGTRYQYPISVLLRNKYPQTHSTVILKFTQPSKLIQEIVQILVGEVYGGGTALVYVEKNAFSDNLICIHV